MKTMKSKQKFVMNFSPHEFFITFLLVASVVALIALFASVAISGYHYQFDIDEIYYAQITYLLAHGLRPYTDVYITLHPAVFHWVIAPAFWITGFTISSLYAGRLVMIVLLAIRLACAWWMLRIVFSKRTAFLFLFLFLFDPFAVFTTMQLRPDNLMLTVYTLGLLLFALGITKSRKFLPFAGLTLGTALVVLPKIAPGLGILGIVYIIWCILKKRIDTAITLTFWGMIPALLYSLYCLWQGSFHEMILQTFIESKLLYTNYTYQVPINMLMRPDNAWIFGTMGKPITWVYLWLMAPIGLTGVYHAFHTILSKNERTARDTVQIILGVTLLAQWAPLFMLQVAFMQHYMPFHWLCAAFGAYAIDRLLEISKNYRFLYGSLLVFLIFIFAWLTKTSIDCNLGRATIAGRERLTAIEKRWGQIPADQAVFPGFLFRPLSYPVPYDAVLSDIPIEIMRRLPDMTTILKTTNPVVLIDDYTLDHLQDEVTRYIRATYTRVPGDTELMVKK
jgi:4-amino-4-deoxy-L-arabinose transferase-like glycosyltransferase